MRVPRALRRGNRRLRFIPNHLDINRLEFCRHLLLHEHQLLYGKDNTAQFRHRVFLSVFVLLYSHVVLLCICLAFRLYSQWRIWQISTQSICLPLCNNSRQRCERTRLTPLLLKHISVLLHSDSAQIRRSKHELLLPRELLRQLVKRYRLLPHH